ncbi:MAG TPA: hypothetical protein VIY69_13080 [Candidatus Acidoferrales bacterium]
MNWLKIASLICTAALSFMPRSAAQTERFPPLATSESPWNVLVFAGKGEIHGAPNCHALPFFSSSPKDLDFDADFLNEKAADLTTRANLTLIGKMSGRNIYELVLTVHGRFLNPIDQLSQSTPPTLEALLVQRRPNEYCDIFENQYTYDPSQEINETGIVRAQGRDFLKTYQTDRRTWILEYWEITSEGPQRLDLDGLYKSIRSDLPHGEEIEGIAPLDLAAPEMELRVEDSHGTDFGTLDLALAVQGTKFVIVKRVWTPE